MTEERLRLIRTLVWALWGMLLVMSILLFGWFYLRGRATSQAVDLPVYKSVGDFSLTNRDGTTVTPGELSGKPYVADFIFTTCPGVCPVLSRRMQELAALVPPGEINFVSISVDPETDSPEVLQAYAARHEAKANWFFLTGGRDEVHRLVKDGFQLVLDDSAKQGTNPDIPEGREPIVHSNRFVLVDGDGRIRGYYNAFDEEELEQLLVDLSQLL
ncbi:MAG: SCO family protein [Thermoanaerobaculia bacterium]|nr:SCO family protein [Thermoanaerobaculia bacterium]